MSNVVAGPLNVDSSSNSYCSDFFYILAILRSKEGKPVRWYRQQLYRSKVALLYSNRGIAVAFSAGLTVLQCGKMFT